MILAAWRVKFHKTEVWQIWIKIRMQLMRDDEENEGGRFCLSFHFVYANCISIKCREQKERKKSGNKNKNCERE